MLYIHYIFYKVEVPVLTLSITPAIYNTHNTQNSKSHNQPKAPKN